MNRVLRLLGGIVRATGVILEIAGDLFVVELSRLVRRLELVDEIREPDGQVWRVLKRDQIETSAAISSWLGTVNKKKWEKQGALFLDEPVNGLLKGPDIGFSLRNYPQVKDGHQLMPLFSFYSHDGG